MNASNIVIYYRHGHISVEIFSQEYWKQAINHKDFTGVPLTMVMYERVIWDTVMYNSLESTIVVEMRNALEESFYQYLGIRQFFRGDK